MALAFDDRVKETSTTTGTGTYSLAGAVTGFQTFVAGIGNGNTCWYGATDGTDWETGLGTVTDATPDTLARTTIFASSNSDAAVNWGAGTKTLYVTLPASKLSTLLDTLVGSTQGQIAYRGASTWSPLSPGTANQRLITGGSGANPSWGGGIATIASGSFPAAATLDLTSIPAFYSYLVLQVAGASCSSSTRHPRVQVSTNNGSSFDTTSSNYGLGNGSVSGWTTDAGLLSLTDAANSVSWSWTISIFNYQGGPNMNWIAAVRDSGGTDKYAFVGTYLGSTSAINALRVLWSGSGNFDAGTYALYGIL